MRIAVTVTVSSSKRSAIRLSESPDTTWTTHAGSKTGSAGTGGPGTVVLVGGVVDVVGGSTVVVAEVMVVVVGDSTLVVVVDGCELLVVVARGAVVVVGRASGSVAGVVSGSVSRVGTVVPATVTAEASPVSIDGVDGVDGVDGPSSLLLSVQALAIVNPPTNNASDARLPNMRRG